MRVCLVISQLCAGGAEGVMARLANHWVTVGHEVTLITVGTQPTEDYYQLLPAVSRVGLGLMSPSSGSLEAVKKNVRIVRSIRRALRDARPEVVVSFMAETNVSTLLASAGFKSPVAVCERIDPRRHSIGRTRDAIRRLLYPRAAAIVVQTEALRAWAKRFGPSVHVVQNALDLPPPQTPSAQRNPNERRLLAMGRLDRQKGFDLLITAFCQVQATHPAWTLEILGEGPERGSLEAQISEAGMQGRIRLVGKILPPWDRLRRADLFVLSSRYEGFPNALLEAMACGLAVVATDCPTGPSDIVRHGVDGLLVPPEDVGALAAALSELMSDDEKRRRLATMAQEVTIRFAPSRVLVDWDKVLASVRT